MLPDKFLKPYDYAATEGVIYKRWEESGFFNPDNLPPIEDTEGTKRERNERFSIVLPPPNVTGILHMGSALMLVIEDVMVRYARMRGKAALWIPGTDSAAIATQARVEKDIQKAEKKSRYDLGREELLKRIDSFVEENKSTILKQFRGMGASLDWSRYLYTMDKPHYDAVIEAFVRMYDAGLIYRGNRVVNWDPKGQTTISDDEIEYEERDAKLYTFRYSKDFPIAVATTRLETKVGDTAVAVHPDDARYKDYIGKEYDAVFCDVPVHIKVIADKEVDPAFGTGALGVTPAHSMADWEIAERHNLPRPQIIDERARMTVEGRLNGKKTAEAREVVAEWLRAENLLEKEEAIKQNVSLAQRTGAVIEPLPKLQWWVNVSKPFTIPHSEIPGIASGSTTTLKDLMRAAVESGETKFVTERYERIYFNWIDNLRDWCISRQIWFGHRIPVWYRGEELKVQPGSPGEGWSQDEDVLDTWFSSGLWTMTTLGWPTETADLKRYHPTDMIESGYDLIFFWIARMILMSTFLTGEVPFRTIYFHGLVRDEKGRKISKSLGNNIDPMDMSAKYGTDAVRLSLVAGMAPGTDSSVSENKIKGYKLFANKLWNVARFVLSQEKGGELMPALVEEFDALAADVTADMEAYRYHLAVEKLYHYLWDRFAAEIIEESKGKPQEIGVKDAAISRVKPEYSATLYYILEGTLKLLHPFMPFITEEIWGSMPETEGLLMVAKWPERG